MDEYWYWLKMYLESNGTFENVLVMQWAQTFGIDPNKTKLRPSEMISTCNDINIQRHDVSAKVGYSFCSKLIVILQENTRMPQNCRFQSV
jgi:hypothetical protein